MEECDIRDFSDMPKDGIFNTSKDAKDYIIKKFGKISSFNKSYYTNR